MKIALDIRYQVRSGASTYMDGVIPRMLAAADPDMSFVYVRYDSQEVPDYARGCPEIISPTTGMLGNLLWMNTKFPRLLREHDVDLYHSLKVYGPIRCPVPAVHTIHGMVKPRGNEFPMSIQQKIWHSRYGCARFKDSRMVIAVSEYLGDFLKQDLGIPSERVAVIHNGINDVFLAERQRQLSGTAQPPAAVPGLPSNGKPILLCVGNIEAVKNHVTAVRALARIADKIPHHLVIAGRPEKACGAELDRVIKETGMQDRVHLIGFVSQMQVVDLFKHAEALIHPSTSEGLGFSILEAMACGLPVIGSDIPGIREALGDAGRLIESALDDAGFAQAIQEVVGDRDLAKQMSQAGLKRAGMFSWDRCAKETLAVYRKCFVGAA